MNPTEWLTLALVVVTVYYAWQTRQTVNEMRRARAVAVLPRMAVSIKPLVAGIGWVRLSNAGPGPAFDLDASISLLPDGWNIPWNAHLVAPGEAHDFHVYTPDNPPVSLARLEHLVARFSHVRLVATYRDALGDAHRTDETIEIRDWWHGVAAANSLAVKDWGEELTKELEKLRKAVEKLSAT